MEPRFGGQLPAPQGWSADQTPGFGGKRGQGGVDQGDTGEAIPVGLPAEVLHARFPPGPLQAALPQGDGQLDSRLPLDVGQDILDGPDQIQVADHRSAVVDRAHHPQGEGARGGHVHSRDGPAGALRLAHGEAVDAIAVELRPMDAQQRDALRIMEVQGRQAVIGLEPREDWRANGQQARPVPAAECRAQPGVDYQHLSHGVQRPGLLAQHPDQVAGNLLLDPPAGVVEPPPLLDQDRPAETDHQNQQSRRQRGHQAALGRHDRCVRQIPDVLLWSHLRLLLYVYREAGETSVAPNHIFGKLIATKGC